jgi:hypothetical protein
MNVLPIAIQTMVYNEMTGGSQSNSRGGSSKDASTNEEGMMGGYPIRGLHDAVVGMVPMGLYVERHYPVSQLYYSGDDHCSNSDTADDELIDKMYLSITENQFSPYTKRKTTGKRHASIASQKKPTKRAIQRKG